MRDTGVEWAVVGVSAMLDLHGVREWTIESLAEFLSQERDSDLDWRRFEIIDGMLVVSPPPTPRRETLVHRLGQLLEPLLPDEYAVTNAIRIEVGRSHHVTDLTVVTVEAAEADEPVPLADVLIAVEIESPSSITTDRITKPAQYASAGIPYYWRVETDPVGLSAYRLVGGTYAHLGTWTGDELDEPFTAALDLSRLARRVARDTG